jgi:hypothetical protein
MVKKATGADKDLHAKRLKLKRLHQKDARSRAELEKLPPEELPPASSSNAARQLRSRMSNTFPVNWAELHREGGEDGETDGKPERGQGPD